MDAISFAPAQLAAARLITCEIEISRLRSEAGFFVDAEIERFILLQVGE